MTDETFIATISTAFPSGKYGVILPFWRKPDGTVDRERTLDNLKYFPLASTFTPEQRAKLLSGPPEQPPSDKPSSEACKERGTGK